MIVYENRCTGCSDSSHCRGRYCPNRNVKVYICNDCGYESTIYEFDGEQLCIECIKERLEAVH